MRIFVLIMTYRGTVFALNAIVLVLALGSRLISASSGTGSSFQASYLLVLLPFALPFPALTLTAARRALLGAMLAANALLFLVVLPFIYFASTGADFAMYSLLVAVCVAVPVVNIASAWLRLRRKPSTGNVA